MRTTWIAAAFMALLTTAGCGKHAAKDETLPGPGQMKVLSISDAALPERGSLLKNGDFDNWFAGASVPDGLQGPDGKYSKLVRSEQMGAGIKSRYQVNQVWTQDDAELGPEKLFGIFGEGLQPNTTYTLRATISGKATERTKATLSVYEAHDGQYDLIAKDLITTTYDRNRVLSASFTTKLGGRILVASRIAGFQKDEDKIWHRVTWHAISVIP